jgi:hypothetical protein
MDGAFVGAALAGATDAPVFELHAANAMAAAIVKKIGLVLTGRVLLSTASQVGSRGVGDRQDERWLSTGVRPRHTCG